ncbi:hypothetical protein BDP55DRAFT_703285 [Colletotrichum godetiae]|uniref:NAD-dependent epimerase/dehydratase domain-containing protein n=1 Tax=Colletotrichum godetiae TaxID=1209918 RepID=A0AAJ0EUD3_9PEZI|nr:uncharacterized protein BDP55DRAFT_703285 [Colletotrichum godetiae]KAK1687489.1 hypothetical protein BDP55DRAFT_703285 [Colletotrichum godetiae]
MSSIENPVVPKGLIAVITGANGYIASHIADHFIQNGYRVRGTVRNPKKSAWLVPHFEIRYGTGKFELHIVPDMQVDAVYDEAMKGVSILVHTATVVDFNGDPAEVIGGAVTCGMVAIQAAYKEQSMRRFILTSSASTLMPLKKENFFALKGQTVDVESYSHDAKELAWAPPPWGIEHGGAIYGAIVPDFNFGRSIEPSQTGGSSSFGFIDDAALHVAAAILPDVKGERIFAFAYPMNWDIVLDILRRQNPGRKFADNFHDEEYPVTVKPVARAEGILKRLGRPGWISLEQSIATNTEHLQATKDA